MPEIIEVPATEAAQSPLLEPVVADRRFELRLSKQLMGGLDLMARSEGIPRADVVRRALGLYELALDAEEKGHLVGFATIDDDGTPRVEGLIRLNSPSSSSIPQSQQDTPPRIFKRFELRASQSLLDGIDEMARSEGIPRADVVRRALGLYAHALEATNKGRLVIFAKLNNSGGVDVVDVIKLR
jgi:hypothetical protein